MSTEQVQAVTLAIFVVQMFAAVAAAFYISRAYHQRSQESPFLRLLVRNSQRAAVGCVLFLVLILAGRLGYPLSQPYGSIVAVIALGIILWSPVATALAFRKERES